jgi:predicted MFS family arabinose efflux permease
MIFLLALAVGSLFPANGTSMSRVCPPESLTKGFALNRLANNLGATIGPAVGGFLALVNYRLLFWVDGLTCLAAALLFHLIWKHPEKELRHSASGQSPRGLPPWRDFPFLALLLLVVIWGSVFIQLFATFPLYMKTIYGFAENRIGQLLMINTLMIVTLEMVLMDAVKKFLITRTISLSFLFLGVGFALMPLGRGFSYAALTVVVWTFGEMLSMPLVGALIAGRAGPQNLGRYMGMFSSAFSLAFILGPAAGTLVYDRFGPAALWFGCGGAGALLFAAFSALSRSLTQARSSP